jgi:hypothetical protein
VLLPLVAGATQVGLDGQPGLPIIFLRNGVVLG